MGVRKAHHLFQSLHLALERTSIILLVAEPCGLSRSVTLCSTLYSDIRNQRVVLTLLGVNLTLSGVELTPLVVKLTLPRVDLMIPAVGVTLLGVDLTIPGVDLTRPGVNLIHMEVNLPPLGVDSTLV